MHFTRDSVSFASFPRRCSERSKRHIKTGLSRLHSLYLCSLLSLSTYNTPLLRPIENIYIYIYINAEKITTLNY